MIGLGLEETLLQYLRAVGWSVTAAVGFAFGVGSALKVFDYLSTDIDEWEEIKKGNIGVSLIFISLISLASGVLLALIFIQIRNMRTSKEIQYDFEEASDDKSSLTTLPSDLSIKNDIDQQQFDLAVTYYEMSDKENALALLKNLIQTTKNSEIREASEDLLEKVKQL